MPDTPRAHLLSALTAEDVARGVYVLEPGTPEYPGSPFDVLLPTDGAQLVVDVPGGPLALLVVDDAGVLPDEAVTTELDGVGTVAVAAPHGEARAVSDRFGDELLPALRGLATTTAPFAWAGPLTDDVDAVVELDGDRLRATLTGGDAEELADEVRRRADGGLPGSPGKRWRDLVTDVDVRVDGDDVVATARTTALPAALLRTLLDRASGAAR